APGRLQVPLHEADEVLDRPGRGAGAPRERVARAEPADLAAPVPLDLAAALLDDQRVRRDGFGRGVEAARPACAAPLDAAVADLVAFEAALEDRPVEAAAPAPPEAALSREAGGLRLRIAEPAPAARQHRLELGE